MVHCNVSFQAILKITYLRLLLLDSAMNCQHFLQACGGPVSLWICVSLKISGKQHSSILGSVGRSTHQDQGYMYFALMPETNPRQGGLYTDLDQTSMFSRLVAAAEGYPPAFQRSLSSLPILILHCQDTAARQND